MFFYKTQDHEYEPVPQPYPNEKRERRPTEYILRALGFVVIGVLISTTVFCAVMGSSTLLRHTPKWLSCGDSPETARARGCSFDIISFAWQTPECYDEPLVNEFLNWDNWEFFTEREGNHTVPRNQALQGEQNLFMRWKYHVVHCTFMWRQMHRAYECGYIPSHLHAYNHTLHCQHILLARHMPYEVALTEGDVIYPTCDMVGGSDSKAVWVGGSAGYR